MNSVKTITIDNHQMRRPIALSRSSTKVIKGASLDEVGLRSNSTSDLPDSAHHYSNIEARKNSLNHQHQATRINISATTHVKDPQHKQIKLVINNDNSNSPSDVTSDQDNDSYLSTLIDEYQVSLNRKDCDNSNCHRFRLLSYRISQTLFERINSIKNELQLAKKNSVPPRTTLPRQTKNLHPACAANHLSSNLEEESSTNMDKDNLLSLVVEKDKRIQDLERLVDDQRRLRLQDATQVEEKAARIKEWVANKLKELECQNKQLRDQNRKQKEAVESLSTKLAMMSPISSPRRVKGASGSIHYIDQASPIETVDIDKSLVTRRPQLKKAFQSISSSSEDENAQNSRARLGSGLHQTTGVDRPTIKPTAVTNITIDNQECSVSRVLVSKNTPPVFAEAERRESPVYDSVTVDQINRRNNNGSNPVQDTTTEDRHHPNHYDEFDKNDSAPPPPPPPLHQSDKWELELYSLADQTFSSLTTKQTTDAERWTGSFAQPDSIDSNSDKDISISRKSSSSLKNDLIALVKPSFTTIDGDQVVDDFNFESDGKKSSLEKGAPLTDSLSHRNLSDQSSQFVQMIKSRKDSSDSCENIEKPLAPNLFDSPMRSRAGKDNILRTQSVRRNPAPEKLYDFIAADLSKRGYLVKPGALKNHNRWFVLKNFHLYSYKCEAEETIKATPNMKLKLEPSCQVVPIHQSNDSNFPFKLSYPDKTLQLIADTAQIRDEWIRMLTVTINMSDIEPDSLAKHNCTYDGIMSVTRHGHTKRYYATLVNHVVFFLRSLTDPTPISYLSVRGSRVREITDNYDYDFEEQELLKQKSCFQDCSLAIYPKFSLNLDPVYITLGSQQDTDKWFYFLSIASGIDQSYGTQFERNLTKLMIKNSMSLTKKRSSIAGSNNSDSVLGCPWREHSVMLYSDKPITQPLTSLPNETHQIEAIELFKSILLFTQVPLEPVAIDYHVSLLQNCLGRFLKYPELRNEFYAQLIKQCTYVIHRCSSPKLSSSGSSGCSSINQRSSICSLSPSSSECQFITDVQLLDSLMNDRGVKVDTGTCSTLSQLNSLRGEKTDVSTEDILPPSQSELLQVLQILAVAVSLNLPRGRMRWWLIDHLRKFANPDTNIGKYALYTLRAIDRTVQNGTRDNVPSRTEIMSILLRNPYDHSNPHSLPVSFADGSYLVVEADGSTTVDEFMSLMTKDVNIRHSLSSDFYLFADDPAGSRDLHILEPQRKVLDIVGWWEKTCRQHNSGRYQNTKAIKLMCKKRLVLRAENEETQQERLLIMHQISQEVVSQRIPLNETLILELGAIMAQLTFGDLNSSQDPKLIKCKLEKISSRFLPNISSQPGSRRGSDVSGSSGRVSQLVDRWQHLSGRSAQDCVRVYLNCIRRLKLGE